MIVDAVRVAMEITGRLNRLATGYKKRRATFPPIQVLRLVLLFNS